MVTRNHKTYPITEIIPTSKLKILPWDEQEDFLVMKRTEKGIFVSGLKRYFRAVRRRKRKDS